MAYAKRALDIRVDQLGRDHLDVAYVETMLSWSYELLDKKPEAIALLEHVLKAHTEGP